eukprot:Rmarinus@m.8198
MAEANEFIQTDSGASGMQTYTIGGIALTLPKIVDGPRPTQPIRMKDGRATMDDVQLVQMLIERCLQCYMSQFEVVTALHVQANIEPGFTHFVWEKLDHQNPEFFRAYQMRLRVKEQIKEFNMLVAHQTQMTTKPEVAQSPVRPPQPTSTPHSHPRGTSHTGQTVSSMLQQLQSPMTPKHVYPFLHHDSNFAVDSPTQSGLPTLALPSPISAGGQFPFDNFLISPRKDGFDTTQFFGGQVHQSVSGVDGDLIEPKKEPVDPGETSSDD